MKALNASKMMSRKVLTCISSVDNINVNWGNRME